VNSFARVAAWEKTHESERSRVLVVNLVDHLVESRKVKRSVEPVVTSILDEEENGDLMNEKSGEEVSEEQKGESRAS